MALHRGIQSAIFFYASCAPCAEARYRKKRRKEAERGRQDRDALAVEIPNLYRHPSPSSTNPHWAAEIEAGPRLEPRGKWKGYTGDNRIGPKTSTIPRSIGSRGPSSVDVSSYPGSRDGRNDSKFDFKQHQRDDDELWGSTSTERLGFSRGWQSAGITQPERAHTRESDTERYTGFRNPQLNDLHPATVTKLTSRDDARWMFQPPPTSDVMSGHKRAPRSRSDSGNSSRLSARSNVPLGRDLSQRVMERKFRHAEGAVAPSMSRESSQLSTDYIAAQQHEHSQIEEKDFGAPTSRSSPSPKQTEPSEDSNESASTVIRRPDLAPEPLQRLPVRRAISKPQLSTIMSESMTSSDDNLPRLALSKENFHQSDGTGNERDRSNRRSALVTRDESLKVLQELAPSSRIFKTQVVSPDDLVRASKKKARMPSQDRTKDRAGLAGDFDPEVFGDWDAVDLDWIHEHTKREVRERWSMDI